MLHMLKTLRVPRWEDYEIKRRDGWNGGNMWRFLGDGTTERERLRGMGGKEDVGLAPWMRNGDVEWSVDV